MRLGEYSVFTSIVHAPHIVGRTESFKRMMAQLGDDPYRAVTTERAPPHIWSELQWNRARMNGLLNKTDHALFLNDDLVLSKNFWEDLGDRIDERPNDIISLYCSDPRAVGVHAAGHRWYTSTDGLIGNAYVIPQFLLRDFLKWRERDLVDGAVTELSEDQLVNLWAMCTGRRIYHAVPSLVEHDTGLPSCYGNESNPARTSSVTIDTAPVAARPSEPIPHLGRFFHGNHYALLTHVKPECWGFWGCVRKYYQNAGDFLK